MQISTITWLIATLAFALASTGCSEKGSGSPDDAGGGAGMPAGGSSAGGSGGAAGSATGGSGGRQCPAADLGPDRSACTPASDFGPITTPSPLISLERPVFARSGVTGTERLVDGLYHSGGSVNLGLPEDGDPAWVAIELEPGPTRVLLLWGDGGFTPYDVLTGGAPLAYRVETSADSSDGEDGTWTEVASVDENIVRARAHSFDFTGQSWVRLVVTGAPEGATGVRLDELEVHDLSGSDDELPEDSWLLLGDSITQGAFYRDQGMNAFDRLLAAEHPEFSPIFVSGGIGGALLGSAGIADIEDYLEINPDFRYVGIAFGTNDAWGNRTATGVLFETNLRFVIEAVLDAGRVPVLATIPYAPGPDGGCGNHRTLPEFNEVIDRLSTEYELPCGPDLYAWFRDNPLELSDDGVHPNSAGYRSINRLWAEAASVLYEVD